QLLALEPTLSIEPLRGNVDTRLRKRRERGLDAVVLAACGLDRLGLGGEIGHRFDPDTLVPEAGQGAPALQVRAGEEDPVRTAHGSSRGGRATGPRASLRSGPARPTRSQRRGGNPTSSPGFTLRKVSLRRSRTDPAVFSSSEPRARAAISPQSSARTSSRHI